MYIRIHTHGLGWERRTGHNHLDSHGLDLARQEEERGARADGGHVIRLKQTKASTPQKVEKKEYMYICIHIGLTRMIDTDRSSK